MFQFQLSLFYDLQMLIQTSSFYRKYYLIFQSLDLSSIPDKNVHVGRSGYSRHAMLRAFIVKSLERIKFVPDLIRFLDAHPLLTELCGFSMGRIPHDSQFYRFLSDTNNSMIENIHLSINKKLVDENVVSLSHFIMDSKPVMAATRENNFKNPYRNAYDKEKQPKRNPSASLGYYSYLRSSSNKKTVTFFWGYRTHVIVSKEGVPLVSTTLPNNITDPNVARKLIKKLKRVYKFKKGAFFIADAAYDERDVYAFIVDQLKCQAFIPINPRNTHYDNSFGPHGAPLCDAGLEMYSWGTWTEGLRRRSKFRCPLKAKLSLAKKFSHTCPVNHLSFAEGKAYGCTKTLDITDDARSRVPRNSSLFIKTYRIRTEVERYFSRLGDREAEQTTHYKMRSIKNQMTIAHLSMSLIACTAALLMRQPEKIRCYRTFADDWQPVPLAG